MLNVFKNLWLGLTLIVIASALLLLSDLNRRQGKNRRGGEKTPPRLAVMQWASTDLLDSTVAGIVQGLRQQGFEDGRTAARQRSVFSTPPATTPPAICWRENSPAAVMT